MLASLKLGADNIARARTDDVANAVRTAQALMIGAAEPALSFVFDSLIDVDRGYCPRNAFLDRRFDPRLPARVFTWVNAWLAGLGTVRLLPAAAGHDRSTSLTIEAGDGRRFTLVTRAAGGAVSAPMNARVDAGAFIDVMAAALDEGDAAASSPAAPSGLLLVRH